MRLYASFEEHGYTVEAYMPSCTKERLEWTVRVRKGTEVVREVTVPMTYEPRFGPDAGDVTALEEETDKIMRSLQLVRSPGLSSGGGRGS